MDTEKTQKDSVKFCGYAVFLACVKIHIDKKPKIVYSTLLNFVNCYEGAKYLFRDNFADKV